MEDEVLILQFPSKLKTVVIKLRNFIRQYYIIILQLPLWFSRYDYVKLSQTMNHAIQSRRRYSLCTHPPLSCPLQKESLESGVSRRKVWSCLTSTPRLTGPSC